MKLILGLLLLAFAAPLTAQGGTVIHPKILVAFGGLSDDPHEELLDVRRVLRMPSGEFVVVNGKPLDVRVFDARGRYLRSLGRAGAGPGEFRYTADVFPGTGDTVLVFAAVNRRWSEFDLGGRLLREYPVDNRSAVSTGITLTGGYFMRHHLPGSRGCANQLLAGLPPSRASVPTELFTDASGRVWVNEPARPERWRVTDPGTNAVHVVQLPVGIRVEQFVGDQMIGLTMDEDDADHVVMLSVPRPAGPMAPPRCDPPPAVELPVFRNLKIHTRNLSTAMEAVRSDLGRYPESMEPVLKYVALDENTAVTLLASGSTGWGAELKDRPSGARCIMSIGRHGIPGWESGTLVCEAPTPRSR